MSCARSFPQPQNSNSCENRMVDPPRSAGSASSAAGSTPSPAARKVVGWPKRCKLDHAFLWGYSDKRLKLAQLLGQLSLFLTWPSMTTPFFAEAQNGRDSASDRKPVVSTYRVNTWPSGSMPHVSGVPVHEITHNAMVLALRRLADHRLRVAPARDHLRTRFRQSSLCRLTNTGH